MRGPRPGSLYDQPDSFGWISIGLHWASAVVITLLWFVGMSIAQQSAEAMDARRSLHITIGLIAWLPLAGRIAWRFLVPHPWAAGQSARTHQLARTAHLVMLGLLVVMLLTGPLVAWLGATGSTVAKGMFQMHALAARVLLVLVILHVLAALKHLMFHDDETIARIFVPRKRN